MDSQVVDFRIFFSSYDQGVEISVSHRSILKLSDNLICLSLAPYYCRK